MSDSVDEDDGRGRPSKVKRLIEKYDLSNIALELERRFTAEENRQSLRELATYFNLEIFRTVLDENHVQPLDGEVENMYRLLTDDDVSDAQQTSIERRLDRDGIDVPTLMNDFVSYQSIRTFLKKHRNVEYEPSETDPKQREITNLQGLRGRTVSVTEEKISLLENSDDLVVGSYRTVVEIKVLCEDCNTQFDVFDLIERGGCGCVEE